MVSYNNPLVNDFNVNNLVFSLNELLNSQGSQSEINQLINQLGKTLNENSSSRTHKKEIIKLVDKKFIHVQKELKEKAGLIPHRDIICSKSQGKLDPQGQFACAVICQKALVHYLSEKPINNKHDVYSILKEGIAEYKSLGFKEKLFFEDSFGQVNANSSLKLVPLTPEHYTEDEGYLELMRTDPINIPMEGVVEGGFSQVLEALNTTAASHDQQAGGVLTCNGETIVVFFPEKDKPQLFDSHGRRYLGEDKGASLRKFDSIEQLDNYLKTIFKNPKDRFIMVVIGKEELSESSTSSSSSLPELKPAPDTDSLQEESDLFEEDIDFEHINIPPGVNIFPQITAIQNKFYRLFGWSKP